MKQALDQSDDLDAGDLAAFFEPRKHLLALTGFYNHWMAWPNRLACEYVLFGDSRCDFVVGDSTRHAYTFVEYENARPSTLLVQHGAKATRDWAPRFDWGSSQIIDWFYKLRNMTDTPGVPCFRGPSASPEKHDDLAGPRKHATPGIAGRLFGSPTTAGRLPQPGPRVRVALCLQRRA